MSLFEKVFGTHSDKELKKIYPIVDKIEALDSTMQALSDEELKAKTPEFKERLERARHWMICFQKHLPLSVRQQTVFFI